MTENLIKLIALKVSNLSFCMPDRITLNPHLSNLGDLTVGA